MRPTTLATAILSYGLLHTTHAQLIPFFTNTKPTEQKIDSKQQHPMANAPGIQLPPANNDNPNNNPNNNNNNGAVILSDVIATARQTTIFASFCRDIDPVSRRLDTTSLNTTVLAPLNSAISDLPRKPWEDPEDYATLGANAYEGKNGEDRAHRNLRRFTEAHVVPQSPWTEGEKVKSLGGGEVWWEKSQDGEGKAVVMPGNVEVEKIVQKVANGEVWILKGVLNYAS